MWDKFSRGINSISIAAKRLSGALDAYLAGGALPTMVLDFTGDELFAKQGTVSTQTDTIDLTRTGLATMTDSDGLLKWNPHNQSLNSENYASWTNGFISLATRVDNTITIDAVDGYGYVGTGLTTFTAADYSIKVTAVCDTTVSNVGIRTSGVFTAVSLLDFVAGVPQTITLTGTSAGGTINPDLGVDMRFGGEDFGFSVTFTEFHLYRSDLGGMADNPDTGTSYVPTTSAAVYMPRRNHHVYDPTFTDAPEVDGTELVTNGTFDTDTDWTKGTGWTISGGQAVATSVPAFQAILQASLGLVSGSVYEVSFDVVVTAGGMRAFLGASGASQVGSATISTTSSVTYTCVATATDGILFRAQGSGFTGTIDNVSVKEINPYAVIAGYRHESAAATNLLTYSQDFTDASWGKVNTATLALDAVGPDGVANSAVTLLDSGATGTGDVYVRGDVTVDGSSNYTFSIFAKQAQVSFLAFRFAGVGISTIGSAWFNLSAGTVGTTAGMNTTTIEDVGNGWYRCSATVTSDTVSTSNFRAFAAQADNSLSVDLDGTSSILIYGAQLETGSIPTSYIPTAGATVTRAADVATIPIANVTYPSTRTEVTGTELVTNGTFDTDTTGWTSPRANSTLSVVGGELVSTATAAGAYGSVSTVVIPTTGVYAISTDYSTSAGNSSSFIRFSTSASLSNLPYEEALGAGAQTGTTSTNIVLAAGTYYIGALSVATGASDTVTIDNVSVKEVTPLATSFGFKGLINYADNDNGLPIYAFFRWYKNSTEQINWGLSTNTTRTGQVTFSQSATVSDTAQGPQDSYAAGINVPISLAARHGETFINGAIDGVSLTENTTPGAFPAIEATDLEIGYEKPGVETFNGVIQEFIMWSEDIADAGIEEASA